MIRKIADAVYVEEQGYDIGHEEIKLLHECEEGEWMHHLALRENDDGPMYWCSKCGTIIDNGEAMAIRLYEANY